MILQDFIHNFSFLYFEAIYVHNVVGYSIINGDLKFSPSAHFLIADSTIFKILSCNCINSINCMKCYVPVKH